MEKKGKPKNKNKNNNNDSKKQEIDFENLKEQLDLYINTNEVITKHKEVESEISKNVNNIASKRLRDLQFFKDNNEIESVFNLGSEAIKQFTQAEINCQSTKVKLDQLIVENKEMHKKNQSLNNKLAEQDEYIKTLVEKIKQNETIKNLLIKEEEKGRLEMGEKVKKYVSDLEVKYKAQLEPIIKENETLREQLTEAVKLLNENPQRTKEKLEEEFKVTMDSKIKDLSDQSDAKIKEITDKSEVYLTENRELKSQLKFYSSNFEEFNNNHTNLKKEYDKVCSEYKKLSKEYENLKVLLTSAELNVKVINGELEKKEKQIQSMVNLNKTMQEQLKTLKTKVSVLEGSQDKNK